MPAYSVEVNRSHRSEYLKIEYYACLHMKSQVLFLVKDISVQTTIVGPLPIPVERTIISLVERTTIKSSGVYSVTPS